MIRLLLAAPLLATAVDTVDVYALGLSAHARHQDRDCRWFNPGLGLGFSSPQSERIDVFALAVRYRDSNDDAAFGMGFGARYVAGDRAAWHSSAAVLGGLLKGSGVPGGPVLLPILGAGYGPVSLEAVPLPAVAIGVWLRCSWSLP